MESVKNRERKKTAKALLAMRRPRDEPLPTLPTLPTQTRGPPHNTYIAGHDSSYQTPGVVDEGFHRIVISDHFCNTMPEFRYMARLGRIRNEEYRKYSCT